MVGGERVLFVHAHPDDETLDTGGTIATLVDRGAHVTVLTCTRGERGEVIPDDLKAALDSHTALAELRQSELSAAMSILGVTDHRYLGGSDERWGGAQQRDYVDSGMRWGEHGAEATDERDAATLTAAELEDVASDIASVIVAVDPEAVVSYDAQGGYGHPDHIRAHDAARLAADSYGVPFYTVVPRRVAARSPVSARKATERMATEVISVDATPVLDRKRRALAAYRSQLTLDGDTVVLSGGQRLPLESVERFALLVPASDEPVAYADQHPAVRVAVAVLAGVIGAGLGALLSVYNQATALVGGRELWTGAVMAVIVVSALLAGLRLAFGTRVVPGVAAVAMIVIVGILSLPGAGGAVIIPWNGPGIVWQVAPAIIALVVLAWPRMRGVRPGKIARRGRIAAPVGATSDRVAADNPLKGPQQQ